MVLLVIVEHNTVLPEAQQGFGTVHHAAFRLDDRAVLEEWIERLSRVGLPSSGYVNRHFKSHYTQEFLRNFIRVCNRWPWFYGR